VADRNLQARADSPARPQFEPGRFVGRRYGRIDGWDPVNAPMVRHWCEAMGVRNPVYTDEAFARRSVHGGLVAPPTMLQVWLLAGLNGALPSGAATESIRELIDALAAAGYPAVVAVNSEQHYVRYLRPGDRIHRTSSIESIEGEKRTALGCGYFVTELIEFFDADRQPVGTMRFRLFVYRPHAQAAEVSSAAQAEPSARAAPPKPSVSQDTAFFWEGLARGEILIQQCEACGALRHPPGPACPHCHSLAWRAQRASGLGVVHACVVVHHPKIAPFDDARPVALIQLDEGVRLVARQLGADESAVRIGERVRVECVKYAEADATMSLPAFRVIGS
jgi:uncharacterized protein